MWLIIIINFTSSFYFREEIFKEYKIHHKLAETLKALKLIYALVINNRITVYESRSSVIYVFENAS